MSKVYYYGTPGPDTKFGDDDRNFMYGYGDNDTLFGSFNSDKLYGGNGNDDLSGSWGSDLVDGGKGDDMIDGSWGNDRLIDRAGSDVMTGGAGADQFVFKSNHYDQRDHDTITDFDTVKDTIVLDHSKLSDQPWKPSDGFSFRLGDPAFADKNDHNVIIYDIRNKALWFVDYGGKGGEVSFVSYVEGYNLYNLSKGDFDLVA